MPFAQIKRSKRLRVRLAMWYGGAFAVLIIAATLIVYEGLRYQLVEETDFRLFEDAKETAQAVAQYYPDENMIRGMLLRKAENHTHERLFLQWLDVNGTTQRFWAGQEIPGNLDDLQPGKEGVFRIHEVGIYRVAQRTVEAKGVPKYVVRVGASQEQINTVVWKRTRIMILVGSAAMIIAILGAYWIAGGAIQPLTVITRTADRLRPAHLDERLPIRGTGDELDHLSRTINRFLDRIGEYLSKNREFVANAAHELRSPLAAIRSSVDVALGANRSPEEYQSLLVIISDECAHLTTVVNQLLILAESDAGRGLRHSEVIRLDRLVEMSVEMFHGVAEERGVTLEAGLRDPGWVVGNPSRLRQVINNLIDNAVKFTPSGGRVRVDLEASSGAEMIVLRISDSGGGISEHDLPHVFERFYRGEKSRERGGNIRGTGLGLAITRAVVEEHGGTITAESAIGHGSTFTVTLPAHKSKAHDLEHDQTKHGEKALA